MAVPSDGALAYLTWRLTGRTADGGKIMEVGVIGHGNAGAELTNRVAEEVRTWSEQPQNRTIQFELSPTGTVASDPSTGRFTLDRPHHPLTVIWE